MRLNLEKSDADRRRRVRVLLAARNISVQSLASGANINYCVAVQVINGTRRSRKNEERIAAYLGVPREELFPAWNRSGKSVLSAAELAELKDGLAGKGGL